MDFNLTNPNGTALNTTGFSNEEYVALATDIGMVVVLVLFYLIFQVIEFSLGSLLTNDKDKTLLWRSEIYMFFSNSLHPISSFCVFAYRVIGLGFFIVTVVMYLIFEVFQYQEPWMEPSIVFSLTNYCFAVFGLYYFISTLSGIFFFIYGMCFHRNEKKNGCDSGFLIPLNSFLNFLYEFALVSAVFASIIQWTFYFLGYTTEDYFIYYHTWAMNGGSIAVLLLEFIFIRIKFSFSHLFFVCVLPALFLLVTNLSQGLDIFQRWDYHEIFEVDFNRWNLGYFTALVRLAFVGLCAGIFLVCLVFSIGKNLFLKYGFKLCTRDIDKDTKYDSDSDEMDQELLDLSD